MESDYTKVIYPMEHVYLFGQYTRRDLETVLRHMDSTNRALEKSTEQTHGSSTQTE